MRIWEQDIHVAGDLSLNPGFLMDTKGENLQEGFPSEHHWP
jgi:hypothetical protein